MEEYDVAVIGGGPAGYAAAMRALDFKKKVLLIEAKKVGGTGIYNGALSSKTLWEISEKVADVNETIVNHGSDKFEISWAEVKQTLNEAIFDRKIQYSAHVKLLQTETENRLFYYERGRAKLLDKNTISITKKNGDVIEAKAKNIVLATGSRPRNLPNINSDGKYILTSDHMDSLEDFPKSLVIIGAGVIGCEYATIFSNFGKTKVYMVDKQPRILPFEDNDIASLVARNLEKNGVTIHHGAQLKRLEVVNDMVEYEVEYPDGKTEVIQAEKALLSVGRVPNIENLGLEELGIKKGKRNIHIGDNDTQTSVDNIYACGDVTGHIALVNMGELEGRQAIKKMFKPTTPPLAYNNVSTIMFMHPEVAAVGMNEQMCVKENIPCKIVKLHFSLIARAIAMRKTQGFFKIIVTDDDEMKILGMRAIGPHASSAIQAVALLIKMNESIRQLSELVHPHPSIIEGIQECVRMLLNKSIFKAAVFQDGLKCYRNVGGVKTELNML